MSTSKNFRGSVEFAKAGEENSWYMNLSFTKEKGKSIEGIGKLDSDIFLFCLTSKKDDNFEGKMIFLTKEEKISGKFERKDKAIASLKGKIGEGDQERTFDISKG